MHVLKKIKQYLCYSKWSSHKRPKYWFVILFLLLIDWNSRTLFESHKAWVALADLGNGAVPVVPEILWVSFGVIHSGALNESFRNRNSLHFLLPFWTSVLLLLLWLRLIPQRSLGSSSLCLFASLCNQMSAFKMAEAELLVSRSKRVLAYITLYC